jgi:hypothetical protein
LNQQFHGMWDSFGEEWRCKNDSGQQSDFFRHLILVQSFSCPISLEELSETPTHLGIGPDPCGMRSHGVIYAESQRDRHPNQHILATL